MCPAHTRWGVGECVAPNGRMLRRLRGKFPVMYTLLWIVAAVLVVAGIFGIVRGQLIWGIALIVAGLLIGPGGVSVLT